MFVALSTCAHLLLVLLGPEPPAPSREPAATALEVELIEPPPSEPAPSRPEVDAPPVPSPAERSTPLDRLKPRPLPPRPGERETPPARVAPPLRLSMRGPDLAPSDRFLGEWARPTAEEARAAAAADRPRARKPPAEARENSAAVKRKLDAVLAEDDARRTVESGRVHPDLYTVLRDADGMFRPDWSIVHRDPEGIGTIRRSTKDWVVGLGKSYLERLRRYRARPRSSEESEAERNDILKGYSEMVRAADDNAGALSCQVCVVLGRGEAPRPRVVRSSGRAKFDRLAQQSLLKAARSREMSAEVGRVDACYHFKAKYFRVPPVPMVGCSFDESKPAISCYYPTKKMLRTSVRLLSVRSLIVRKGS